MRQSFSFRVQVGILQKPSKTRVSSVHTDSTSWLNAFLLTDPLLVEPDSVLSSQKGRPWLGTRTPNLILERGKILQTI